MFCFLFRELLIAKSFFFFFSSRRRHTRFSRDWSSDVCSSDLDADADVDHRRLPHPARLARHVRRAKRSEDRARSGALRLAFLKLRVLPVAVLCALVFPASGWAHANLLRTVPENGAVLSAAPAAVRLLFDDTVRPGPGMKAIRNGGGSVLAGKPRVAGGRTLVVPLRPRLPEGDYTVLWRVVSDD